MRNGVMGLGSRHRKSNVTKTSKFVGKGANKANLSPSPFASRGGSFMILALAEALLTGRALTLKDTATQALQRLNLSVSASHLATPTQSVGWEY